MQHHIENDKLVREFECVCMYYSMFVHVFVYWLSTYPAVVCVSLLCTFCSWHIAAKFLFVDDAEAALVRGMCLWVWTLAKVAVPCACLLILSCVCTRLLWQMALSEIIDYIVATEKPVNAELPLNKDTTKKLKVWRIAIATPRPQQPMLRPIARCYVYTYLGCSCVRVFFFRSSCSGPPPLLISHTSCGICTFQVGVLRNKNCCGWRWAPLAVSDEVCSLRPPMQATWSATVSVQ